jgi:hypothetical protein
MEEIRKLLMRCAEDLERSSKIREEAQLLIMKARILRPRLKARMRKRHHASNEEK